MNFQEIAVWCVGPTNQIRWCLVGRRRPILWKNRVEVELERREPNQGPEPSKPPRRPKTGRCQSGGRPCHRVAPACCFTGLAGCTTSTCPGRRSCRDSCGSVARVCLVVHVAHPPPCISCGQFTANQTRCGTCAFLPIVDVMGTGRPRPFSANRPFLAPLAMELLSIILLPHDHPLRLASSEAPPRRLSSSGRRGSGHQMHRLTLQGIQGTEPTLLFTRPSHSSDQLSCRFMRRTSFDAHWRLDEAKRAGV